jgi:hypothetical protein
MVELALVGLLYFLVLFFVIQGGLYYIRVTVLDFATEVAARAILINNNPGYQLAGPTTALPTTAALLRQNIANAGYGFLDANNIAVSVKVCAPVWQTGLGATANGTGGCLGGFQNMPLTPFTPGTFQYFTGTATVNLYQYVGSDGSTGIGVIATTATTGTCNTAPLNGSTNGNVANGTLSLATATTPPGGVTVISVGPGASVTRTEYDGALYTCGAGQDFLLQVQYTDTGLVPLVSRFIGPITATLAFALEPSPT